MAVFYKQDTEKPSTDEGSFVGKLFNRAKNLSETVPTDIRDKLATLSAEVNGKTDELKKATKENADKLKMEIRELTRTTTQGYVREDKTAQLKKDKRFEKLLANKKGFDTITAGDIGRLRENGENIAKFLLTDDQGDEIDLTSANAETLKNKKLLINFGDNRSLNASIGLGDILPYEVKRVEITDKNGKVTTGTLGSKDSRKGRRDRVGYYNDENGSYMAIYGGYSIKILETGTLTSEDKAKYEGLQNENFKRLRINEMINRRNIVGEKYKEEFQDPSDILLFDDVERESKNRDARKQRNHEAYGKSLGRERFLQLFGTYVNEVCKKYDLPPGLLIRLFEKENDTFDFTRKAGGSSAHGFGQITDDTWSRIENKVLNLDLDRDDPKDQILASVALLADIKKRTGETWPRTAILYHAGEGLLSQNKDKIDYYLSINAKAIQENFKGNRSMTDREYAEEYAKSAELYYKFGEITDAGYTELKVPKSELALKGYISHPIEYTRNGVTACSRTAWKNLGEFGIIGPKEGSAKESESQQDNQKLSLTDITKSIDYNVVDIYVDSNTANGSQWGHRAMGVRGSDNIWYVMDPYNGAKNPLPLDVYLSSYSHGTPNPRFYGYKSTNYLARELLS